MRPGFLAVAPAVLLGASSAAGAFDAEAFWSMDAVRAVPLDVEIVSTKVENCYLVDELYFTGDLTPDGPNRIFCPLARPEQASDAASADLVHPGGVSSPAGPGVRGLEYPRYPVPVVLWLHPGGGRLLHLYR